MDNLNRFIDFYQLDPDLARKLREYFFETRANRAAETRQEICAEMSQDLKEMTLQVIHGPWLHKVPFFKGMHFKGSEGKLMVPPVSEAFLAQVTTELRSEVFAPTERPPLGRLYVISKGSARFKGKVRQVGFSWGSIDVMLPNAPVPKRAVAITYLHVLWINGPTLRSIAKDFPSDARALRVWTLWAGLKEFLKDNLRKASDAERQAAREWVHEHELDDKSVGRNLSILQASARDSTRSSCENAVGEEPAGSIPELQSAMERRINDLQYTARIDASTIAELQRAMDQRLETLERKLDQIAALPAAATVGPGTPSSRAVLPVEGMIHGRALWPSKRS